METRGSEVFSHACNLSTDVLSFIRELEESTDWKLFPSARFVSCGHAPPHEHFVPKDRLVEHIRRAHTDSCMDPPPHDSHKFFYTKAPRVVTLDPSTIPRHHLSKRDVTNELHGLPQQLQTEVPQPAQNSSSIHKDLEDAYLAAETPDTFESLIEPSAPHEKTDGADGALDNLQEAQREFLLQYSIQQLYNVVFDWNKIPRIFRRLNLELVKTKKLEGWIISEVDRILPSTGLELDLVEYLMGLLEHPEFSQPDLLMAELHEFVGEKTRRLILSLWKFLVVEIALNSTHRGTTENEKAAVRKDQSDRLEKRQRERERVAEEHKQQKLKDREDLESRVLLHEECRDYKRRTKSYRAKKTHITKRTPHEVIRDTIRMEMEFLTEETHWNLVRDTAETEDIATKTVDSGSVPSPDVRALLQLRDPLQVRDMRHDPFRSERRNGHDRREKRRKSDRHHRSDRSRSRSSRSRSRRRNR